MQRKTNNARGPSVQVVYRGFYDSLRILMHFIALVETSYAIYYDYKYVKFPASETIVHTDFGGKFKYLTFLNAIIQALYFLICLINDFIGSNDVAPKPMPAIRKVKDYVMSTFAFPLALNVGVTFWTLYSIDRELVFPKILDAVFPNWLNHILHTNIMVFIVLELFTSFRVYPERSKGIGGLSVFMLIYLVWIHIIKYYSGVWVYPVLEVLALPQRIMFFVVVLIFTISLYMFGEIINNTVWNRELKLAQRKDK